MREFGRSRVRRENRGPSPSAPTPPEYVIAIDDVLTVAFWQDQITATEVVVRPDGKISLPLLNDVQAAGFTPQQLAAALEQAASKYITEPDATVIVKEIRSRKVFVLGEVEAPGMVPLVGDMTVLQLIAVGGGLLEYADKSNIVIIRTENGTRTTLQVQLQRRRQREERAAEHLSAARRHRGRERRRRGYTSLLTMCRSLSPTHL